MTGAEDFEGGGGLSILGAGGGTGLEGESSRFTGGATGRLGEGFVFPIGSIVSAVFGT